MAGTTINGLNAVTSLTAQDEVPVWDAEASGEPTKKITAQNMAASVKTLGSLVNTNEMNSALAGKQNTLTFDTTPTTGSTNPVTSGGIATAIEQSTASVGIGSLITTVSQYCDLRYAKRTGGVIIISLLVKSGTPDGTVLCTFDSSIKPAQNDYVSVLFYGSGQLNTSASVWIESSDTSKATYYGSTATAGAYANIVYGVE